MTQGTVSPKLRHDISWLANNFLIINTKQLIFELYLIIQVLVSETFMIINKRILVEMSFL